VENNQSAGGFTMPGELRSIYNLVPSKLWGTLSQMRSGENRGLYMGPQPRRWVEGEVLLQLEVEWEVLLQLEVEVDRKKY